MPPRSLSQALRAVDAEDRCIRTWMRDHRDELLEEFGDKRLDLRRFIKLVRKLRLTNDQGGEVSPATLSRTWKEVCATPQPTARRDLALDEITPGVRRSAQPPAAQAADNTRVEFAQPRLRPDGSSGTALPTRSPADKIERFRQQQLRHQPQMPDVVD